VERRLHDFVDTATPCTYDVGVRLEDVPVVTVGRVAELEFEHLTELLQELDRVIDRGLPHHGESAADAAKHLIGGRVSFAFRENLDDGEPLRRDPMTTRGQRLHHLLDATGGWNRSHSGGTIAGDHVACGIDDSAQENKTWSTSRQGLKDG
jgi:hypothetical protein